jgi:hypothetical protein
MKPISARKKVTFIPEGKHYRVLETGYLCSLPIIGIDVTTIENYTVGISHSAHANIDETGSVEGMKKLGYWHHKDRIVKARGFYYNMSTVVCSDILDELCYHIEKNDFYIESKSTPRKIQYIFPQH